MRERIFRIFGFEKLIKNLHFVYFMFVESSRYIQ